MTLHSRLTLATPMHAVHLGTKRQTHTEHYFTHWDCMSLLSSRPSLSHSVLPQPATSSYFLFCSSFAIANVTVADNSLW